jgi:hypothetical protein
MPTKPRSADTRSFFKAIIQSVNVTSLAGAEMALMQVQVTLEFPSTVLVEASGACDTNSAGHFNTLRIKRNGATLVTRSFDNLGAGDKKFAYVADHQEDLPAGSYTFSITGQGSGDSDFFGGAKLKVSVQG